LAKGGLLFLKLGKNFLKPREEVDWITEGFNFNSSIFKLFKGAGWQCLKKISN